MLSRYQSTVAWHAAAGSVGGGTGTAMLGIAGEWISCISVRYQAAIPITGTPKNYPTVWKSVDHLQRDASSRVFLSGNSRSTSAIGRG